MLLAGAAQRRKRRVDLEGPAVNPGPYVHVYLMAMVFMPDGDSGSISYASRPLLTEGLCIYVVIRLP